MKTKFGEGMFITTTKLLIEDIDRYRANLEDWEVTQIEAFKVQLDQGRPLSANKTKILRGIHSRTVK